MDWWIPDRLCGREGEVEDMMYPCETTPPCGLLHAEEDQMETGGVFHKMDHHDDYLALLAKLRDREALVTMLEEKSLDSSYPTIGTNAAHEIVGWVQSYLVVEPGPHETPCP